MSIALIVGLVVVIAVIAFVIYYVTRNRAVTATIVDPSLDGYIPPGTDNYVPPVIADDIPLETVKTVRLYIANLAGDTDKYINIREIEVIKDGQNIALNKDVTGTEPYDMANGVKYPLTFINDGILDNMYHSKGGSNQEVVIDIGYSVTLPLEVIVYNRTDCCQERIVGAEIQLLNEFGEIVRSTTVDSNDAITRYVFE